jgi:hypothetical protein
VSRTSVSTLSDDATEATHQIPSKEKKEVRSSFTPDGTTILKSSNSNAANTSGNKHKALSKNPPKDHKSRESSTTPSSSHKIVATTEAAPIRPTPTKKPKPVHSPIASASPNEPASSRKIVTATEGAPIPPVPLKKPSPVNLQIADASPQERWEFAAPTPTRGNRCVIS